MQYTTSQIASVDANAGNQFNQTVTVGGTTASPITYGGLPASGTSSASGSGTSSSWGLILIVAAAFYFFIVRRS